MPDSPKIAVVTGASYGIGATIAQRLLDLDYKVYGISRSQPKLTPPNFVWLQADLTHSEAHTSIPDSIKDKQIDLLVNNAGIATIQNGLAFTDEAFEKIFALNFRTPIKLTQALAPRLSGGAVINISSLSDRYPDAGFGLYCASKTALNLFFECMAIEDSTIKIINILPSYVDTPLQHVIRNNESSFDWSWCMPPSDVADCLEQVITHINQYPSGARVAIEKVAGENSPYNPEKLWVYAANTKKLSKIR